MTVESAKSRLAARRAALREERPIDIPVPGYEGILVARYQPLEYPQVRRINKVNENEKDDAQREINTACDILVHACVGLYSVEEDGRLEDLGHRWNTIAARELFEITDLPEGATARDAVVAVFPSTTAIILHTAEYSQSSSNYSEYEEKTIQGESEAT